MRKFLLNTLAIFITLFAVTIYLFLVENLMYWLMITSWLLILLIYTFASFSIFALIAPMTTILAPIHKSQGKRVFATRAILASLIVIYSIVFELFFAETTGAKEWIIKISSILFLYIAPLFGLIIYTISSNHNDWYVNKGESGIFSIIISAIIATIIFSMILYYILWFGVIRM